MKTILIVDDNKLNLAAARKVLSDDYKVIPVMKGQQALTYLENGECDVILLDINMPEMDGFEVLERIRQMEQCRNTPVIFLTADSDAETETRCFRAGAIDFIAKPFIPDVMLSRISRILELEDLRLSLADRLEQKTQEASDIRIQAQRDALTGLWNRVHTEEAVNRMLRDGARGALMMMDIDNFKSINDNYGHITGDKVLQMFAEIMRRCAGEDDILCRLGGDEFVIFTKELMGKSELSRRAESIIAGMRSRLENSGLETNASLSIGIAQALGEGTDFATLYNCSDKALYYVKQNGKNGYHFFSDRLQAERDRAGNPVDLRYLQDLMNREDTGDGVYHLDFDSFHYVYNFIRRLTAYSSSKAQLLLLTVCENENTRLDETETERALELLEKAVYSSLRWSDVATRYSARQLAVILMETTAKDGEKVAERVTRNFRQLYTDAKVHIDYSIASITGRGE